jgi:hypothetical protein
VAVVRTNLLTSTYMETIELMYDNVITESMMKM